MPVSRRRRGRCIGRSLTGCVRSRCIWWCCSTRGVVGSRVATSASTCSSSCRATWSRNCCCGTSPAAGRHPLRTVLRATVPAPAPRRVRRADRDRDGRSPRSRHPPRSSTPPDRSKPRSCTSRTGTSSTKHPDTSARTSPPTRCCSSGRSRSKNSSTCSGPSRSAALFLATRRLDTTRQLRVIRTTIIRRRARVRGLGTVTTHHQPQPRLLRHRRPRLRTPRRRLPRARPPTPRHRPPIPTHHSAPPPSSASPPSSRSPPQPSTSTPSNAASPPPSPPPHSSSRSKPPTTALIKHALSNNTIVYLGKISYGTYLWHWIVILVAIRTFHLDTTTTIAITAGSRNRARITVLPTPRTTRPHLPAPQPTPLHRHRHRTHHQRHLRTHPHPQHPRHPTPAPPTITATTTGFTKTPPNLDWQNAGKHLGPFTNCYHQPVTNCTTIHGTGPHILLIGDSHAHMLIPTLTTIAKNDNLTLSIAVRGGCPWQQNLYAFPATVNGTVLSTAACKSREGRPLQPRHPPTRPRHHHHHERRARRPDADPVPRPERRAHTQRHAGR